MSQYLYNNCVREIIIFDNSRFDSARSFRPFEQERRGNAGERSSRLPFSAFISIVFHRAREGLTRPWSPCFHPSPRWLSVPIPLPSSGGRAYLESVLVDTALVLPHGRVIRALSLLRLSSLAPCQRARARRVSLSRAAASVLTAPCFLDIFPFGEP